MTLEQILKDIIYHDKSEKFKTAELRDVLREHPEVEHLSRYELARCIYPRLYWRCKMEKNLVKARASYNKKANKTLRVLNEGKSPLCESGCLGAHVISDKDGCKSTSIHSIKTTIGLSFQDMIAKNSRFAVRNIDDTNKVKGLDLHINFDPKNIAEALNEFPNELMNYKDTIQTLTGEYCCDLKDNENTQTGSHADSASKDTIQMASQMGCKPAKFRLFGESSLHFDKNGVLVITGRPLWFLMGVHNFIDAYTKELKRIIKKINRRHMNNEIEKHMEIYKKFT